MGKQNKKTKNKKTSPLDNQATFKNYKNYCLYLVLFLVAAAVAAANFRFLVNGFKELTECIEEYVDIDAWLYYNNAELSTVNPAVKQDISDLYITPKKRNVLVIYGHDHNGAFKRKPYQLKAIEDHETTVFSIGTKEFGTNKEEIMNAAKYLSKAQNPTTIYIAAHGSAEYGQHYIVLDKKGERPNTCVLIREIKKELRVTDVIVNSCHGGSVVLECPAEGLNIVSLHPLHIPYSANEFGQYRKLVDMSIKGERFEPTAREFLRLFISSVGDFEPVASAFITENGKAKSISGIYCDLFIKPITPEETAMLLTSLGPIYGSSQINFIISAINYLGGYYPFHKGVLMHMASLLDRTPTGHADPRMLLEGLGKAESKYIPFPVVPCNYGRSDLQVVAEEALALQKEVAEVNEWATKLHLLDIIETIRMLDESTNGDKEDFVKKQSSLKWMQENQELLALKPSFNLSHPHLYEELAQHNNASVLICPMFDARLTPYGQENEVRVREVISDETKRPSKKEFATPGMFLRQIANKLSC